MTSPSLPLKVLSLGGGVQSSTLALMCCNGEFQLPDLIIFADTRHDHPAVYTWLRSLTTMLDASAHPLPVGVVRSGKGITAECCTRRIAASGASYVRSGVPAFTKSVDAENGRVYEAMMARHCTTEFKIRPIHRHVLKILRSMGVQVYNNKCDWPSEYVPEVVCEMWMGISTDEASRMKDSKTLWALNRYPLVEIGMSRDDCIAYMEKKYGVVPPKSACVFCPYQTDAQWRHMKDNFPGSFREAVAFERKYQRAYEGLMRGFPYLHPSRVPLDEVDFSLRGNERSWENECGGTCGL